MGLGQRVSSASSIRSNSSPRDTSCSEFFGRQRKQPKSFISSSDDDRSQLKITPDEVVYKTSSLALLRSKKKGNNAAKILPQHRAVKHEQRNTTYSYASERQDYLSGASKVLDFMYNNWQRQQFCDMVIVLENGELYTHKVVFAAHGEELANKFAEFPADEVLSLDMSDFDPTIVVAVANFLYTMDVSITDDIIGELLPCASELGLTTLTQLCCDYLKKYDIHNAILYHSVAEAEGLTSLVEEIFNFICVNFTRIVQSKQFVHLAFEQLANLISRENLSLSSELEVFYAVVTWVNYNRTRRLALAPMLLRCVRFQLMPPEMLVTKVEAVDWIFEPRECHKLLYEAYKFHSLQLSDSGLATSFPAQYPRGSYESDPFGTRRFRSSLHYIMKQDPKTQEVQFIEKKPSAPQGLLISVAGIDLQSLHPDLPGRTLQQLEVGASAKHWSAMASLQQYTHHHGAVVLAGKIYIVGGAMYDNQRPNQLGAPTNAVLVYDPEDQSWASAGPMTEHRAYHGTVLWGQCILAVGGESDNHIKLSSIELYDPGTDSWRVLCQMPGGPRLGAACAVFGDLLYVVGGFSSDRIGNPVLADVECYSLAENRWVQKKSLRQPRCHGNLVVVMGRMLLIGGRTRVESSGEIASLSEILEYDVVEDRWTHLTDMTTPRHDAGVTAMGSRVYIVGGMTSPSSRSLSSVECYDLATGHWIQGVPPLPAPATGTACCTL